jgi:hypothetical protein
MLWRCRGSQIIEWFVFTRTPIGLRKRGIMDAYITKLIPEAERRIDD